jgi:hypothetical protein
MVVQIGLGVPRIAIPPFGVAASTPAAIFRASSVAEHALVAVCAIPLWPARTMATRAVDDLAPHVAARSASAGSLPATAPGSRPRCLARRTPLLPLAICRGHLLGRPRPIE